MDYEPQDGTFDSTGSLTGGSPHDSLNEALDVVSTKHQKIEACCEWVRDYIKGELDIPWEKMKEDAQAAGHDLKILIRYASHLYKVRKGVVNTRGNIRWCHSCGESFNIRNMSGCACPHCESHDWHDRKPMDMRDREYRARTRR